MTTVPGVVPRQVYFHDPGAPAATVVRPAAFAAVRRRDGRLLLVRRVDNGAWELPGGRVDVGETAVEAAVRETAEEAGVQVEVTELAGLFTDPGHVVRSAGGEVHQRFAVVFRARAVGGAPRGDQRETSAAAWVPVAEMPALEFDLPMRFWIGQALATGQPPHLG